MPEATNNSVFPYVAPVIAVICFTISIVLLDPEMLPKWAKWFSKLVPSEIGRAMLVCAVWSGIGSLLASKAFQSDPAATFLVLAAATMGSHVFLAITFQGKGISSHLLVAGAALFASIVLFSLEMNRLPDRGETTAQTAIDDAEG